MFFFKVYDVNNHCVKEQAWVSIYFFIINWKRNTQVSTKMTAYKESILGVRLRSFWFLVYVIEDRKIRNTCFLFFPVFIFGGWKLRSKLGLKNHFCGKNGLFENLVSQSYFAFKDTKFVHWHYSPLSLIVLEIFHKNDFSILTLNAVFTPQIWKQGKIKKHVFLIFRPSITYPKIEMIGDGHLKYSPC